MVVLEQMNCLEGGREIKNFIATNILLSGTNFRIHINLPGFRPGIFTGRI
jgi:hypothetical protein